jgi:hypothetical protein
MHLRRTHLVIAVIAVAVTVLFLTTRQNEVHVFVAPQSMTATAEKAGPVWAYPNPARTPGLANPDINQANIQETICNPEWTRSIRPPGSYTTNLKRHQMQEWGLPGTTTDYEEDHFISLELGGSPKDRRNLWPEPYNPKPGAREKDVVENYLHEQVCAGTMTLQEAQDALVADWYKVYGQINH